MRALFPGKQRPEFEIVATDKMFWKRIESFCEPPEFFDAQGDAHDGIDLRLVHRIEEHLEPILGPWEQSAVWWHQMDVYGTGIRSLSFRRDHFEPRFMAPLRQLLKGECKEFCIVCQIYDDLESESGKLGSIAIRAQKIMINRSLASSLLKDV